MQFRLITLALVATLSSCRVHHSYRVHDSGLTIAEVEDADGKRVKWQAFPGNSTAPRVDKTSSVRSEVATIGLSPSSVSRERAEAAGIEPWVGVYVDGVSNGAPADQAGIRPGDVLLRAGNVDVNSGEQLIDWVQTQAVVGEPFEVEVLSRPSSGAGARVRRSLAIVPVAKEVRESHTESFELRTSSGVQRMTGLQVAEVPAGLAADIYGDEREVLLVTGTVIGSPAYNAGFRRGDRIITCDGESVTSLQAVRDAVRGRLVSVGNEGWPTGDGSFDTLAEAREGDLALTVEGPLGPHAGSIELDTDLDDKTRVHVPILLDYRSDVRSTRTSFLDFIFQFGFNYRKRLHPSATRAPLKSWSLSMLPFGMFEFRKDVDGDRHNTFFWFITFES